MESFGKRICNETMYEKKQLLFGEMYFTKFLLMTFVLNNAYTLVVR